MLQDEVWEITQQYQMPAGAANGCSIPRTVSHTSVHASTWLTANRASAPTSLTTCMRSHCPTKNSLALIQKHPRFDLKGKLVHDVNFTTTKTKPTTDLAKQSILLYGVPKLGKSSFASQFPEAMFFECEPGLNHLEVFKVPTYSWEAFLEAVNSSPKVITTLRRW